MSQEEIEILKRALAREKAARKAAEEILEQKSAQLYDTTQKLQESNKKLEKLVKEKTLELKGVFENIVDAYVVMDLWGNVIKMNDAAINLLGFNNEKDNLNLLELADPSEVDNVMNSFEALITEGSITNFQIKLNTKNGEQKLVQINASIILNDDNKPVAAQGIVRDITLENKYRSAIEAEKQKYSSIIANMNLGLVEVNNDDEIQMINQSFSEMSGYTEEELKGKKGGLIFPVEGGTDVIAEENMKRLKGESNSYEIKVKTKQGNIRHWLISGAPNYDINGDVIGSIGIHLDITDLKSLQLQKENLLSKLEKSNNELQEYAHIVSHDLKSPLRSIDALMQWIKEDNKDKLDEASLQNISHIETTLEKMEQLISDILEYSSIGSNDKEKIDVNLSEVVNELCQILYVPKHINISVANKLPVVKGDKVKLQQLFQNLISNAVKFIDKPKGEIHINVKDVGEFYQFSVSDNGIGIEKQYHDKIFKIFHSLNKSKDSTGVGLSIVKKIVNLHEGEIWLESEPKKGTIFYFTLKK
ncbi:sensor histidine kinase [Gaetbulibacter sp. NE]|uniref:sensor histidine kinase n=1 Tax=Gaetbulibacter sp. NE TaxID=2982307 RepID=UPI0021D3B60A|nr:PAS domain-containing sensor histidine kinase [Gaetbulibacter sp. NE]